MKNQLLHWQDTIVAIATPFGTSALGIIRLSGNMAFPIIDQLSRKNISQKPSHTLHYSQLQFNQQVLDQVIISIYKSPTSFTSEDMVEISAHGSQIILASIIDACVALGARLAKPGEFTQRAFINKKIDLTQAEAIGDLIHSQSQLAHKISLHHLKGGIKTTLTNLRTALCSFSALLELELDFAEEDVEFANRKELQELLTNTQQTVASLLESFVWNNALKEGLGLAIIGLPNAGKSSLLNCLLQEDRAIVSDIAGTTRDTIEERLHLGGCLFNIIDTAGIRQETNDPIEKMGIEKSIQNFQKADIVLIVLDATQRQSELAELLNILPDISQKKIILVANKIDLLPQVHQEQDAEKYIFISAKNKTGIQELKKKIIDHSGVTLLREEHVTVINARHKESLLQLEQHLQNVQIGLAQKLSTDLLSLHLREALLSIGEITGEITTEDTLDYIFSKFCIGK